MIRHLNKNLTTGVKIPCKVDESYRIIVNYVGDGDKRTYVFSGNKTDFVRPGHLYINM